MIKSNSPGPTKIGFLLVPEFSMLAFSSALEPLRMANQLSGEHHYEWITIGASHEPIDASNGISITPDYSFQDAPQLDAVFVCSGNLIQHQTDSEMVSWLRSLSKRDMTMGAICTGTYVLAKADALDGHRCTIHWENMASAREEFPHLVISPELFEIDEGRYTSAGGIAPLDMILHEIRDVHGSDLASAITEQFMCDRIRDKHDRQRVPLTQRIGTNQPKLAEAVSLMEANIEEPMTLDELSHHVGLSRRQLERLYQRYLQCVPTRYYLELRLERARQLLLQTSMPIVDIALACGFISAPHFSKCYRDTFGLPPRDERRRAAGQVEASKAAKKDKRTSNLRRTTVCSASAPSAPTASPTA